MSKNRGSGSRRSSGGNNGGGGSGFEIECETCGRSNDRFFCASCLRSKIDAERIKIDGIVEDRIKGSEQRLYLLMNQKHAQCIEIEQRCRARRHRIDVLRHEIARIREETAQEHVAASKISSRNSQREKWVQQAHLQLAAAERDLTNQIPTIHKHKTTVAELAAKTQHVRKKLLANLRRLFPVFETSLLPPPPTTSISFATTSSVCILFDHILLPKSSNFEGSDEEVVSAALGYLVLIIQLLSRYLLVPLRFPVRYSGSRSIILDPITCGSATPAQASAGIITFENSDTLTPDLFSNGLTARDSNTIHNSGLSDPTDMERRRAFVFPLFSQNVNRTMFEHGLYLLGHDINQLCVAQGITTASMTKTLSSMLSASNTALSSSESSGVSAKVMMGRDSTRTDFSQFLANFVDLYTSPTLGSPGPVEFQMPTHILQQTRSFYVMYYQHLCLIPPVMPSALPLFSVMPRTAVNNQENRNTHNTPADTRTKKEEEKSDSTSIDGEWEHISAADSGD